MKTYKITKGNKQYVVKAKDTYSAVVKLHTFLKDQKQVAKFTKFNNGDIAEGFIMETSKGYTFTSPQNPKDDRDFSTQKLAEIHANKLGYVKDSKPIEDERLSPMTYKKLKELGYNSNTWKDLSQEEANKIVSAGKQANSGKPNTQETKESTKNSDPTVVGKLRISEYDGGPGKMWNHTLTIHKDEDGYYWSMRADGEDLIDTERYPTLDKLKEGYEKERESYHNLNYVESWGDSPSKPKYQGRNYSAAGNINIIPNDISSLSNTAYNKLEPKLIDALKQKNPDVESEINNLSDSVDKIDQKDKLNQKLYRTSSWGYDSSFDAGALRQKLTEDIMKKHPEIPDYNKFDIDRAITHPKQFKRFYTTLLYKYANRPERPSEELQKLLTDKPKDTEGPIENSKKLWNQIDKDIAERGTNVVKSSDGSDYTFDMKGDSEASKAYKAALAGAPVFLANQESDIQNVTPDAYIRSYAKQKGQSVQQVMENQQDENYNKIIKELERSKTINEPIILDPTSEQHQDIYQVMALKQLGLKTIPVLVMGQHNVFLPTRKLYNYLSFDED